MIQSKTRKKRKRLLKAAQVAKRLGLSVQYIRTLTSRKAIPHYKIGSAVRYDLKKVKQWLKSKEVKPVS